MHWSLLPRPSTLLYVPISHGSAALAPSSQNEPPGHSTHAVSPLPPKYVPAAHLSQLSCAVAGCTGPGRHGVCSVEPVEQKEPSGQVKHCSLLPIPVAPLYEPSGHGIAADAPASQYEPPGHVSHAVLPLTSWKVPAAHLATALVEPRMRSPWRLFRVLAARCPRRPRVTMTDSTFR